MDRRLGNKKISIFLLVVFLQFLVGCSSWQMVQVDDVQSEWSKTSLSDKYVIIHKPDSSMWRLNDAVIFENRNLLYGQISQLGEIELEKEIKYIHLYTTEDIKSTDAQVQIPLSSINKIEYEANEADSDKTIATIVGITAGIALFFAIGWSRNF